MTVLNFTPRATHTRMLRELNSGPNLTIEADPGEASGETIDGHGQYLEDLRLGVPLAGLSDAWTYRRWLNSTVWHWDPRCDAWPMGGIGGVVVEQMGAPRIGYGCRACARLAFTQRSG